MEIKNTVDQVSKIIAKQKLVNEGIDYYDHVIKVNAINVEMIEDLDLLLKIVVVLRDDEVFKDNYGAILVSENVYVV